VSTTPDELIGIGEFARRVRLTVKQLRSYDELGLLRPARVDPDTGYRRYHRGQARTAVTIALLRSLDVPLADIRDLLVADEAGVAALLERQRTRIEAELERGRRTLRSLDRLLSGAELLPYAVAERDEPALTLAGLSGRSAADDLDRAAPARIADLGAAIGAALVDAHPVVGLYPLELDGDVEFFVGVAAEAVPSGAPTETRTLAPARVAATAHTGSLDELQLAYFPLIAHVEERGMRPGSPVREVYDATRTEVLLPFTVPTSEGASP
jgi:DNA-binding transcriptional MerR regulator